MFSSIDKQACLVIRTRAVEALEKVASDLGLNVNSNGGKFNDLAFSVKFEFSVKENREGKSKAEVDLEKYSMMYGLPQGIFGKSFESMGALYKIINIRPNSRKYPIIAEDLANGRKFKFSAQRVKLLLDQQGDRNEASQI